MYICTKIHKIMPANKNAVIRYQKIDELLSDRHHHYTMEDITDKVNDYLNDLGYTPVTRRCLEKDINFLEERPFCAPIQRFTSNGYRCIRYSKRNYSIFTKELTKEEESLLSEVINTIGQFEGLPNFEWLDALQEQLGTENHRQIISFSSAVKLKNAGLLASLYDAVSNEQVISVSYKRFTDDEAQILTVHPYYLKEYNKRWYLVCYDEGRNFICTLALDRFDSFTPLPEKKLIPITDEIEHRFDNSIGITVLDDKEPVHVVFWASERESNYIETKKMHHSQGSLGADALEKYKKKYKLPDDGRLFNLFCQDTYELRRELCSHFGDIIVLEPSSLVNEIKDEINRMKTQYDSL